METFYSLLKIVTYPAVFVRRMFEFLLCVILKIDPPEIPEELTYDEIKGHNPHGEFLFPAKAAVFNIAVFVFQLAGFVGFYGTALLTLCVFDVGLFSPATGSIDPMFFVNIVFMYLGICFAANLFPSANSVENFWGLCISEAGIISRVIFIIPASVLRAGVLLENLGVTAILSAVVPIILKIVL